MKDRVCVISTKNPNHNLINTITNIKLYYDEFDIIIIDSDSTDKTFFKLVPKDCIIEYCQNKNWELGAWTYAFNKYNNYKIYMFIQDTLTPNCRIPGLDKIKYNNGTIYTFNYSAKLKDGGYFNNLQNIYRFTDLHFLSELSPELQITGAAHSSFILDNKHVYTILELENPYVTKNISKSKIDSWLSERTVGILADKLNRINIWNYFTKIHGNRND